MCLTLALHTLNSLAIFLSYLTFLVQKATLMDARSMHTQIAL